MRKKELTREGWQGERGAEPSGQPAPPNQKLQIPQLLCHSEKLGRQTMLAIPGFNIEPSLQASVRLWDYNTAEGRERLRVYRQTLMGGLRAAARQNEGLWQQQSDTEAVLNGKDLSTRTLYIAERRLSWLDGSGLRFSLEYPTISLHVMSSDLNAYPPECLYVMVNAKFGAESKESLDEEEEDSDDDVQPITEFRFVPRDKSALEALFTAICECQALHPDPEDEDSDDYDAEKYDVGGLEDAHEQGQGHIPTFYTYEEELFHLTAEGQVTLDRLEGMLSQSVSSPYNIAGVQTEDSVSDYEDGMEVDTTPTVTGQFEDADADH
ncbi:methylosome subunit pICln-like [Sciurus carolinensis]|uniref:methylosome subunit pICln-like n=1 Tax=Sciurus carolinensis TaxID=30640 RepID=UPI001FB450C5|nr:methylosome subunit pICln-like [Sciurus carolinensis]